MAFSETITYDTASSLSFDTSLVEVSGGVVRLKDLGGATYSTANPAVTSQHKNQMTSLASFAKTASIAGSDNVKFILTINDSDYWWNSVSMVWEASDGTYAKSNTSTEINAHAATVASDLGLFGNVYFQFKAFLHSATGATRPSLTNISFSYVFTNASQSLISECTLSAYLSDLLGNIPTYDSSKPTTLYVFSDKAFFHGNRLVQPFTKTVNFDTTGFAQISVIETTTPGVKLSFGISFFDGISRKEVKLFSSVIPNTASLNLSNVALVRYNDFG